MPDLLVSYGEYKHIDLPRHPKLFVLWHLEESAGLAQLLEVLVYQKKGGAVDLSSPQVYSGTSDFLIEDPKNEKQVRKAVYKLVETCIGGV